MPEAPVRTAAARPASPTWFQPTLDDLGEPLRDVTFVVFDLETTGTAPDGDGITEIGAVKVRGGEVLGEFATLVHPRGRIPPFIAVLTGITDVMVAQAPPIEEILPAFLEFIQGAVLVAHNAPYDIGFVRAACHRHGYPWPRSRVVDTAALARRVLTVEEVPNRKLATLARFFQSRHEPCHRALADARATVEVLHGLLERLGSMRVHTLDELAEFARGTTPLQRSKRHLADGIPAAPGVYLFRDGHGRPLYIGTAGNLSSRVRSYFTAAETRSRMAEMLAAAERVETIVCAHALEAEIRELRLIAAHKPPYNRRSKFPERAWWLKLTDEAYPRLSLVRQVAGDAGPGRSVYLGPFGSRRSAELAATAVYDAVPLRQCTRRLSARKPSPVCALAEIGRCAAPCELRISVPDYDAYAAAFREAAHGDPARVLDRLLARIGHLAGQQRYEEAAAVRGRLVAFLRTAVRMQRLSSLTSIGELVAARPTNGGGWDLAVVRHGRLAAAGTAPPGRHPIPVLDALLATAETVRPGPGPTPCASAEETERILTWLERTETRLVRTEAGWALPAAGAGRWTDLLAKADAASAAGYPLGPDGEDWSGWRKRRRATTGRTGEVASSYDVA